MAGDTLSLTVAGDLSMGGVFDQYRSRRNLSWAYPFQDVVSVFTGADIRFANLECCLLRNVKKRPKDWLLWSDPASVDALHALSLNVVSLANNHVADLGEEGIRNTCDVLRLADIPAVGAGNTIRESAAWTFLETRGIRCAFGAYCDPSIPATTVAGDSTAGCHPLDEEALFRDVAEAKRSADVVCVSLHWGEQYYDYPSPEQIRLGRALIDAGVHVVIGHHPHVIQGYERYRHGVIFYSLGNFFLPDFHLQDGVLYRFPPIANRFLIGRVWVHGGAVTAVEPVIGEMQRDFRLVIPEGSRKETLERDLTRLCEPLGMPGYHQFWNSYLPAAKRRVDDDGRRHTTRILMHSIKTKGISGVWKAVLRRLVRAGCSRQRLSELE